MPVVVVVETTILRFGRSGSSARMSWVQTLTSPTLTACIQSVSRLVSACLRLVDIDFAVSVGEVNVCTQLIRALEPLLPNLKIVVSTTTTTGMGELHSKLPHHIGKIYYPIDRRLFVTRALNTIHPKAIVLVEAEIWPNFLWRARDLG